MDKFVDLAILVVRQILTAYGFVEGDGENDDYSLDVVQDDEKALVIDIDAAENVAGILIGTDGRNLTYLQRVCYSALGTRVKNKMPKGFFITVNDRRADLTNGHSAATAPKTAVVTIVVPPGVEVRTRTEGETRAPKRR